MQVAVPLKSDDNSFSIKKKFKNKKKSKGKSKGKFKKKAQKLPEYRLESAHRPLAIHDLLTHTAGLGTRGGLGAAIANDRAQPSDTLAAWVPRMAARPLDFQPGTRWAYSPDDGLKVVGRIIEIASGMPVNAFIQTRP